MQVSEAKPGVMLCKMIRLATARHAGQFDKGGRPYILHPLTVMHRLRTDDEFSFRLNEGNVKHHTMTRLDSFVKGTAGKRLTYKGLIQ